MKHMTISTKALHTYLGQREALRDIHIDATQPELAGIIGPDGGGKRTLLRAIHSALDPMAVYLDKRAYNVTALAASPGITLLESVLPDARNINAARAALALVELNGLEDVPLCELTFDGRLRAALARAVLKQPDCLLIDESLFIADAELQARWLATIKAVGITAFAALSDGHTAATHCDRLYVVERGKVCHAMCM